MKNVGVLLSGCGFLDGAEIRESVFSLLALDELDAKAQFISLNSAQHHVVEHHSQKEIDEKRNVLTESARIARGEIIDIQNLNAQELDALVIPGGFGVAKNLCTFAFDGAKASVNPYVKKLILDIHEANKPIGAMCISPALLALVLGPKGLECTIGNDLDTATAIEALGAKHINTEVTEVHIDKALKVVTTAAYMYGDARPRDIYRGIKTCIDRTLEFCQ